MRTNSPVRPLNNRLNAVRTYTAAQSLPYTEAYLSQLKVKSSLGRLDRLWIGTVDPLLVPWLVDVADAYL